MNLEDYILKIQLRICPFLEECGLTTLGKSLCITHTYDCCDHYYKLLDRNNDEMLRLSEYIKNVD